MAIAEQILFGSLVTAIGVLLIIGVRRRWSWLVDPPEELWFVYSQSFIKKFCGAEFLEIETFYLGIVFIVAGIVITAASVWRAVNAGP